LLVPGIGAQGATYDSAMARLIQDSTGSTYPVSRGITGFGMEAESTVLKNLKSWGLYSDYVAGKIMALR
jgi:hypothetical protein